MPDTDPYEDDGEGYGTSIYRGSDGITTTYRGWLTMLRIALLYGWVPEGGSYSSNRGARRRILSDADATNIHLALERYIAAPHEAYERWVAYVSRPKEQQAGIVPMGDEEYDLATGKARKIDLSHPAIAEHWKDISSGGVHSAFARDLSDFCSHGAFEL